MNILKKIMILMVIFIVESVNADTISGIALDQYSQPIESGFIQVLFLDSSGNPNDSLRYFSDFNPDGTYSIDIFDSGNAIAYAVGTSSSGYFDPMFYDNVYSIDDATVFSLNNTGQVYNSIDFVLNFTETTGDGSISGIVFDDIGNPVHDAEVLIFEENSQMADPFIGFTDSNGEYNIENIGAGNHILQVNHYDFSIYFYENVSSVEDATPILFEGGASYENFNVNLSALNFYTISGIVKDDETGDPIPSYSVFADPSFACGYGWFYEPYTALTNSEGEFELVVHEGEYLLYALERTTPGIEEYLAQFWDHQYTPIDAEIVNVSENIENINFDLTPIEQYANSVSGTVTIEGETPDFDVLLVAISSEEEWEETAIMQAGGNYEIPTLPEGAYYILALSSETAPLYYGGIMNFDDAGTVYVSGNVSNIDFHLQNVVGDGYMEMLGSVVDENGNSVSNTSIFATNYLDEIWSFARTDNDGNYYINNLVLGNYSAYATKTFYNSDSDFISVSGNMNNDFIIESTVVGIEGDNELAITNYELKQNYPNPFNPSTKINYELGGTLATGGIANYELAEIVVYNTTGQEIWSSPVEVTTQGSIRFDGSKFNSGIYYYSLIVDGKKLDTKPMVLIK